MNSFLKENLEKPITVSTLTNKNYYTSKDEEANLLIELKSCDKIVNRNPQNLIFIIDTSGSMDGNPISLSKRI